MTHDEVEAIRKKALALIKQGRVTIANEAATSRNAVVVRSYKRDDDGGGVLVLDWSRDGIGFGQITLTAADDGTLAADGEGMGDTFILEILAQALAEGRVRG